MKQTVTLNDFVDAFITYDRQDQFSRDGLKAIYDYIIEFEDSSGEETELGVIAICCDFTEYSSIDEFHKEYDKEEYTDLETLRDHTQVIEVDDEAFIIQAF